MKQIQNDLEKAKQLFTEVTWIDTMDRKMLDSTEELLVTQSIIKLAEMVQKERLAKK